MTVQRFKNVCRGCAWISAALLLGFFAVWLFVIADDSPAIHYGPKGSIFLTLDGDHPAPMIHLDDMPKIAILGVSWVRPCPDTHSDQFLQVGSHARIDIGRHLTAYPGKIGQVPDKARWIVGPNETMRAMSFGQTGHAVFWRTTQSTCKWGWWEHKVKPIDTPTFEFDILP